MRLSMSNLIFPSLVNKASGYFNSSTDPETTNNLFQLSLKVMFYKTSYICKKNKSSFAMWYFPISSQFFLLVLSLQLTSSKMRKVHHWLFSLHGETAKWSTSPSWCQNLKLLKASCIQLVYASLQKSIRQNFTFLQDAINRSINTSVQDRTESNYTAGSKTWEVWRWVLMDI